MGYIVLVTAIVSTAALIGIDLYWKRMSAATVITDEVIARRKRLRYLEAFLLLVVIATIINSYEFLTGETVSGLYYLLAVGAVFGYNRTFFEPYYRTDIIDDLDDYALYLRSFELDKKSIKTKNAYTRTKFFMPEKLEKSLCGAVNRKVGMVYAIGDPNCVMPATLESSSIYADDVEWKSAVARLSSKAKLIVIRIGDTAGCKWEMLHCFDNDYASKVIFICDDTGDLDLIDSHSENKIPPTFYDFDFKKHSAGIFMDESRRWHYTVLARNSDSDRLIDDFIKTYPSLKKRKPRVREVFSAKPKSPWWDRLTMLTNPAAYILYNRWSPLMIAALALYMVLSSVIAMGVVTDMATNDEELLVGVIIIGMPLMLLLYIPWLWIAPKYSAALNSWGGRGVSAKVNKILSIWMLVYLIISTLINIMLY